MMNLKPSLLKVPIFILKLSFICIVGLTIYSCKDDDNDNTTEPKTTASCTDGILNQDEVEIDCGGICDECPEEIFSLAPGTYRLIWNSTTDTNKSFENDEEDDTNTTILSSSEENENELNGRFLWKKDTDSPTFDIGPINLIIDGNEVSFTFIETPASCKGEFTGTGTLEKNNEILLNITGNDCDGNHVGTIKLILND